MPSSADKRAWVLAALDEFELRLLRYALRLLGDEASARDVVQHTFLRLCDVEVPPSGGGKRPAEAGTPTAGWLFAVVRNRAIDLLRERGRLAPLDEEIEGDWLDGGFEDPAAIVERDDLLALVRSLIDQLPSAQCDAVVLWSEGFSYAEMADITGRSEGNLRVLVHRAMAWLKQHPAIEAAIGPACRAGPLKQS
jgi:RNA polymerase sigma factor (sigma-70 family)